MEPVLPETLTDPDTEFDLDVRVQAVARDVWVASAEKPNTPEKECVGSNYTCCPGTCN
jgi:hypothetical protein